MGRLKSTSRIGKMTINGEVYGKLTVDKLDEILAKYE